MTMTSPSLSQRLQALSDTYKSTFSLIQELQKFPNGVSSLSDDLDEQRLELANACHQSLKDAEESLELLRQEIDDQTPRIRGKRAAELTAPDEERERNTTTVARLVEDIRGARGAFRRAQLQSKKNLDAKRQKERELLFANRRGGTDASSNPPPPARSKGQERLTQDELAQNAANDVTKALRRTHALLSTNLQQSQFAQQTLDESQEQLKGLSERYTTTTDVLQKSRGLVKTLVTSQKSDTWYLQTSVYILLVTMAWLVFRRLLYGPMWWLVWLPLKWLWWGLSLVVGGAAAGGQALASKNATVLLGSGTGLEVAPPSASVEWAHRATPHEGAQADSDMPPSPEEVEKLKNMINQAATEGVGVAALDDSNMQARNPKKRMMDTEWEQQQQQRQQQMIRDEL